MISSVQKETILIVDDTPMNIQVLARALSPLYQIKIASSGPKAIEMMESQEIDLVLLDIMMPEMDGYEVCKRLKSNPKTMNVPIIFVTAKGEYEDEEMGLKMGAVDYIIKPFHLPIVLVRIATHLRLQSKNKLLEQLASIDGLTEIPNRRSFDQTLEKEFARSARAGEPLSVLMFDVDYFKLFNDCQGHAAGDVCLKTVAAALSACLRRPADFLARYGGEEFVAILPNTAEEGARVVAEQMRESVHLHEIKHPKSKVAPFVTISIGGASITPPKDMSPAQLLKAADDMLYKAKESGRNQVQFVSP